MSKKVTREDWIRRFTETHGDRYDYSLVECKRGYDKEKIICSVHGVFEQTPKNHFNGQGCPACAGVKRSSTDEFIQKAKVVHDDKFDYSLVNYINNRIKVDIVCGEHGIFKQSPRRHLTGDGCVSCAGLKQLTTAEFIQKAQDIHGDKFDYSLVEYVNVRTKVKIKCSVHGIFEQQPNSHLSGCGCPLCGNGVLTQELFIQKAREVYGDKYDYSLVKYVDSTTKIKIICPDHGLFEQQPSVHLTGSECMECGIIKNRNAHLLTHDEFIKRAVELHGDQFDYSEAVYVDANTKVKIKCHIHGDFWQRAHQHAHKGHGCPQCSIINRVCVIRKVSADEILDYCKKIHNGKYDYSNVKFDFKTDVINLNCSIHGDFDITVKRHCNGGGCRKCGYGTLSIDEFIEKAREVHGDKFEYTLVQFELMSDKIHVVCPKHGVFTPTVSDHLRNRHNCAKCGVRVSVGESEWLDYLKIPNNPDHRQVRIGRYFVDGLSSDKKTIFEYYGDYWHGNPVKYNLEDIHPVRKVPYKTLYEQTLKKQKKLKDLGYDIVFIWETDWLEQEKQRKLLE
jgi:hypothetical protein